MRPDEHDGASLSKLDQRRVVRLKRAPRLLDRPGKRIGLHIGEEFHRFHHAFFDAIAGIFDAAEGRHLNPVARHFPDINCANIQPFNEGGDAIESVCAHA